MPICVRWHCTARQTVGHTALVSIRVVISQSGDGITCRSTPSTVLVSFFSAAWYAAHVGALHAM